MKKLLLVILVITLAVSLLIGCNPGNQDEGGGEGEGRITFFSNRDGNGDIYVMNADGSNLTRLTDNPAMDREPCFSPDGTKIAFESNRDKGWSNIFRMNADGSNQTRLTKNPNIDAAPSWGP